jgi:hypothetical protein
MIFHVEDNVGVQQCGEYSYCHCHKLPSRYLETPSSPSSSTRFSFLSIFVSGLPFKQKKAYIGIKEQLQQNLSRAWFIHNIVIAADLPSR